MEEGVKDENPILWSSLRASAFAGAGGLVYGAISSVLRASPHPIVVSVAASVEFAVVGGVYTGIKHSLLETRIKEEVTPKTRIYISTLSGSLSFAFASVITRGRPTIIPAAVLGALFGVGYQGFHEYSEVRKARRALNPPKPGESRLIKLLDSKWSPVKKLTNEEYTKIINDKLLKVEAELAIVDERIQAVRQQQSQGPDSTKPTSDTT